MEHLDLAGYLNTPVNWNLGAFEQQDAIYLSSSRQMLEPIMEETSEDEEHAQNSWNGYEQRGFWSSAESETGSVIRVEVNKDIDAMSERDFACPPKRARRSQDELQQQLQQQMEDAVQLRRPPPPRYDAESHNSLERFLALEMCTRDSYGSQRNSTGSRRGGNFEDFYSDNDSYHSLSRSSSLVQFESLERQLTLQEQHQSMQSLGNSSPSLLSCETLGSASGSGSHSNPDSRRGSSSSLLKRFESSDGRLHQTYYELNKLDLEEQQRELFGVCKAELKSDSESSSASSSSSSSDSSSGHSLLSACPGKQQDAAGRRLPLNSAENLSEDSGYCEPSTLRRAKSKSIPKNFDKLCEEEEELEHEHEQQQQPEAATHSKNSNSNDLCQTKIEQQLSEQTKTQSSSSLCSAVASINSSNESTRSPTPSPSPSSPSGSSAASAASFTWLRNSLPDIREPRGSSPKFLAQNKSSYVLAAHTATHSSGSSSSSAHSSPVLSSSTSKTKNSSVPNELQQLGRRRRRRLSAQRSCQSSDDDEEEATYSSSECLDNFDCHSLPRMRRSCSWNERKSFSNTSAGAGYLNASYQNLTLLDYSARSSNSKRSSNMAQQQHAAEDYQQLICKGNFLLDELSQIYDKNASILNDKPVEQADVLDAPPQVQHVQLTIRKPQRQKRAIAPAAQAALPTPAAAAAPAVISFSSFGKTFDQDPTNLRTSYAASLEQCNLMEQPVAVSPPTPRALPKRRFQSSTAKQRSLVSSTPNLSAYDGSAQDNLDDIYVSSAHNSMHQLPQTPTQPKPLGILLPAGSRNSFSKEVSFCPVVSKYCWQEQSSEEPVETEHSSEDEQSLDEHELLDNNDATVIYNTKENENIAARYNEEQQLRARAQEIAQAEERAQTEERAQAEESALTKQERNATIESASLPPSPQPVSLASVSLKPNCVAYSSASATAPPSVKNSSTQAQQQRPLSLHLPILSEPPTNRAHQILYASQQLLQRYDNESPQLDNMPRSQTVASINNNECSSKQQRANKSDEKHPSSKSFLSRFAHGLRFSLRRKKKQQPQSQPQAPAKPARALDKSTPLTNGQAQDFVYIPLKPPPLDDSAASEASTASLHSRAADAKTSTLQKLVTGKPPLPKLPPRQAHASSVVVGGGSAAHASDALLAAERQQYEAFVKQLTTGNQMAMSMATDSPSRASVAQKTQMFNQLGAQPTAPRSRAPHMVTVVPVAVSPMLDDDDDMSANKLGLIETNLDTHETVISGKTRSLMDITCNPLQQQHKRYLVKRLNVTSAAYDVEDDDDVDAAAVGQRISSSSQAGGVQIASVRRPHKSMEFLLDKENQKNVLPPENELQKSHEHNPAALSEHQLRVQASLQRLNIPDWFRQYNQNAARSPDGATIAANAAAAAGAYKPGNFTRKRTQDSGRWQGLNSKTTSLSSLGSQRSDRSPLLLSPSAHSHHGGQSQSQGQGQAQGAGATRWSTSHLNSTQTSPSVSQRGSFARGAPINSSFMSVASGSSSAGGPGGVLRNSYRQPYLGWRSTEKLSQRTPHERLANSLLAQRTSPTAANGGVRMLQPAAVTPEIQSSIKEVTSAIVHYVNDQQQQQQQQRSRSASPNSRKCWLESSFVGTRPLDSPQTPVIDTSSSSPPAQHQHQFHLDATSVVAQQPPLRMNGLSRVGGGGGESTIYI